MSKLRKAWMIVFLVLTSGALGAELWAGLDNSATTVPWTDLISSTIPQPITLTAISVLAAWLPVHFIHHYVGAKPQDRYSKALVPAVTAGLLALGSALTDDTVTRPELLAIMAAVMGGLGVYATSNKPKVDEAVEAARQAWSQP